MHKDSSVVILSYLKVLSYSLAITLAAIFGFWIIKKRIFSIFCEQYRINLNDWHIMEKRYKSTNFDKILMNVHLYSLNFNIHNSFKIKFSHIIHLINTIFEIQTQRLFSNKFPIKFEQRFSLKMKRKLNRK